MMSTTACQQEGAEAERAEMDAVLPSGIFARAPNLEHFFRYICECHLRGEAEQLKEYSIATEALGRAPHFDQKKDSIVRVEAHRLRKRLSEYYAGPGADHRTHINIPLGSYAPQFNSISPIPNALVPAIAPTNSSEEAPVVLPVDSAVQHIAGSPPRWPLPVAWLLGVLLIGAVFGIVRWRLLSSDAMASQNGQEMSEVVPGDLVPAEFRMLAGYHGEPFTDVQGRDWRADAYYSGGRSITLPKQSAVQGFDRVSQPLETFPPQGIFNCVGFVKKNFSKLTHSFTPASRFLATARTGKFRYDIPVREGIYEIHLYFAETEYGTAKAQGGGDASRLFRLSINGSPEVNLFDIHAQAGGPDKLFIKVFKDVSRSADGKIHIAFDPVSGMALLNAIEILPSAAGRIRPIRLVAQDRSVTDANGQVWSADEYVVGGTLVLRHNARFNARDFAIYQGERFGNFTYHLPLAPGKYRLTLHFAETWFGTTDGAASSQEHRLFEIYANGVALIRKFDVLKEAGEPNRGLEKVFNGLEPNAQGELDIQFVPLSNYAEVNAIEVVETE